MNELRNQYPAEIARILGNYPAEGVRSAVMPLLFLAQRKAGYISAQVIEDIAEIIGISTTEVSSVVGFYTLFHAMPGGRFLIQVCTDLPCALRGAEDFLKELSAELQIEVGQTTKDGLFTIEEVKCLAACHRAPVFQVQGDGAVIYHEYQTIETARAWIGEVRAVACEAQGDVA